MRIVKITPKITRRESISLDKYLNEIGRLKLLESNEEVELIEKFKKGDKEALEKLIKANLRFVVSVAKQYQNHGLSLEDLINEGNIGLLKAAERFDETKGFKFISYAVWWIRQTILAALSDFSRIVRIPSHRINQHIKLGKTINNFTQEYEREPTNEELAEILSINLSDTEMHLALNNRHISIDEPLKNSDQEGISISDTLKSDYSEIENLLEKNDTFKELHNAINRLEKREIIIIRSYFGLDGNSPMKLEDIGKICGLTRERVRQLKEKALKRLGRGINKERLSTCI